LTRRVVEHGYKANYHEWKASEENRDLRTFPTTTWSD